MPRSPPMWSIILGVAAPCLSSIELFRMSGQQEHLAAVEPREGARGAYWTATPVKQNTLFCFLYLSRDSASRFLGWNEEWDSLAESETPNPSASLRGAEEFWRHPCGIYCYKLFFKILLKISTKIQSHVESTAIKVSHFQLCSVLASTKEYSEPEFLKLGHAASRVLPGSSECVNFVTIPRNSSPKL